MANYYSDHPEIGFYLNHPLMARIVELKEKVALLMKAMLSLLEIRMNFM